MTKVHCLDSSCKHMYKQWCSLKEILVVNNVDTGNKSNVKWGLAVCVTKEPKGEDDFKGNLPVEGISKCLL